ncbi:Hpt domain-containing protein [Vibrio gallicus]|uniref:Hpt domain-containing protein n=1 Tax=Vibrio gallicus TaxID=190897 RepID=UPI0021C378DD|nr:Hpt domain-containing protein [Vibrio gallicus]
MVDNELDHHQLDAVKAQVGVEMFPTLLTIFSQELQEYRTQAINADIDEIARICHAIKGSASSFGAMQLSEFATQIDGLFKQNRYQELQQRVPQLIDLISKTELEIRKLL